MKKSKILRLARKEILKGISPLYSPCVKVMQRVDSTNSLAKRLFLKNKINKNTLIVAESQTGGRGRCGRSFYSPKAQGLYMTIALKLQNSQI